MTLVVRSLSDRVYEIIRDRIINHDIAPGDAIKQDGFAAEFGVSKVPIREALARLDEGNLVRLSMNKGFVAAPLSLDEVEEIFSLRLVLEPAIAATTAVLEPYETRQAVAAAVNDLSNPALSVADRMRARRRIAASILGQPNRPTLTKLVLQLFDRSERYFHDAPRDRFGGPALQAVVSAWAAGEAERVSDLYTKALYERADLARSIMTAQTSREETAHKPALLQSAL